ncbi:MAG: hypothetical protein AAEJ47_09545 [Planctomycetota bacterium]
MSDRRAGSTTEGLWRRRRSAAERAQRLSDRPAARGLAGVSGPCSGCW